MLGEGVGLVEIGGVGVTEELREVEAEAELGSAADDEGDCFCCEGCCVADIVKAPVDIDIVAETDGVAE